jgi:gelsolin
LTWDIHFWLGSKTSQDESGAVAILSVNMDNFRFNGAAIQHRETQGYESKQFLSYFEPGMAKLFADQTAMGLPPFTSAELLIA